MPRGEVKDRGCRSVVKHRAEWVRRRVDDDRSRARRDERFDPLWLRQKPGLSAQGIRHRHGREHPRAHRKRGVAGVWHEDLIAGREHNPHRLVQRLGATNGHPDALGGKFDAVIACMLCRNGGSQCRDATVRRVVRLVGIPRRLRCGTDVVCNR